MKIAINARNFTSADKAAVQMLIDAGHEVVDFGDLGMGIGTDEAKVIETLGDADIVIAGLEPYTENVFKACPNLKMISRRGIGYDSIDIEACKGNGITLARTFGSVEGAVAEHVMAYILYFSRRIDLQNESMHKKLWERTLMPGAKGRTLGLLGFGGIGKEIAKRASAFGMQVYYHCRNPKPEWTAQYGVKYAPLDDMLAMSDYVSVNVPLTQSTRGLCDEAFFSKMKEGSVFINIARGQVMNVQDLKSALESGRLSGAGIDVFDTEPCTDSPLAGCQNAVLTPHTAPYTSENFIEMNRVAASNVIAFVNGDLPECNRVV